MTRNKNLTNKIYCDICNDVEMDCIKTVGTKESGKRYRQRWFKCSICNYEKKVNGSGYYQEVLVPKIIEKQIKNLL